ncbi:hypothetical protein MBLNU459_g4079t1 [Dothideomycetes sp. NU459]
MSHSLDLDWVDGNDEKCGLLGMASRMALTIGLHRTRDLSNGFSASDLWRTFSFMDMEYSVQCGMPFLLPRSTTKSQEVTTTTPSGFETVVDSAMPTWMRMIDLTHSESVGSDDVEEIQRRMAEIKFPPVISSIYDAIRLSPLTIRHILLNCFHHRLAITLHGPFMTDPDSTKHAHAKNAVCTSARAILDSQALLARLIESEPEPAQTAWAHFTCSLLHCTWYYATESMLVLLRRSRDDKHLAGLDVAATFGVISIAHTLTERALAVSPYLAKEHMILRALMGGVQAQLRLPPDVEQPEESEPVVAAMKDAMDQSIARSRAAIEEALRSDDPPVSLRENPLMDQGGARVPDGGHGGSGGGGGGSGGDGDGNKAAAEHNISDANLEDWGITSDMFFGDVDLTMPWWTPTSLADMDGWTNGSGHPSTS